MSRRPPQNGLFCWWLPWAGPTGSQQLPDRSNNRNHGTMNGFTPSSDWVVDGGWALNFDGTNNYVVSTNANEFEESVGDRQFSFSGWFKTATAGFGTIFSAGVTATNDPSMFLRADATNNTLLQFFIRNGAGTVNFNITSTSAVNTDKWIHVAAINGGTGSVGARLYINGIEEASQATYGGNTATIWNRFGIGATIRSTISTYFNGCMDDVRLYSRALTASEIRNLYLCGRGAGFRESTIAKYNIALTQNISLDAIAATTTVYNPTLTTTAAISLNTIAATTTVYNPTITTGAVTIALNAIAATTTVYQPTILATANIALNAIAATTTVHNPTVSATAAIILDTIAATTQVYEPSIFASGTAQTINLNLIPATTVVYNPTLSLVSNDTSDVLERGTKRLRQEEENIAAQLLKQRQKPLEKKKRKEVNWKQKLFEQINGVKSVEQLEVLESTVVEIDTTAKIKAEIERRIEEKRAELEVELQKQQQELMVLNAKAEEAQKESEEFTRKRNNRIKRLKALMWLAKLDL